MWSLVTYSNYFDIVYTVTFVDSWRGLIRGKFLFNTVLLYHYTINNDYTRYNICSAYCNINLFQLEFLLFYLYLIKFQSTCTYSNLSIFKCTWPHAWFLVKLLGLYFVQGVRPGSSKPLETPCLPNMCLVTFVSDFISTYKVINNYSHKEILIYYLNTV